MRKHDQVRYDKPEDWQKARVWWSAKHKWSGIVHVAVSVANGKVTRCGMRIYPGSKNFKLYEWTRMGNSPVVPTCSQCLRLRAYDKGDLDNPVFMREEA